MNVHYCPETGADVSSVGMSGTVDWLVYPSPRFASLNGAYGNVHSTRPRATRTGFLF